MFPKLRLSVISFNIGILIMAIVVLWESMTIPYKVFYAIVLVFGIYSWLSFATPTFHGKDTNNE